MGEGPSAPPPTLGLMTVGPGSPLYTFRLHGLCSLFPPSHQPCPSPWGSAFSSAHKCGFLPTMPVLLLLCCSEAPGWAVTYSIFLLADETLRDPSGLCLPPLLSFPHWAQAIRSKGIPEELTPSTIPHLSSRLSQLLLLRSPHLTGAGKVTSRAVMWRSPMPTGPGSHFVKYT